MTPRNKIILASALLLVAALIAAYSMGLFTKPVGADIGVEVRCPKCSHVARFEMSYIIKNGWNDAESGWHLKCPKCSEIANVRTPDAWQQPTTPQ